MIKKYPKCPECGSRDVTVVGHSPAEQIFKDYSGYSHTENDNREFYVERFKCRECGHKESAEDTPKCTSHRWLYEEYWGYYG